jgi:molybdopterin molybdotransferase
MTITVDEAIDTVLAAVPAPRAEDVPLLETYERALAADVVAPQDVPRFDNSAMDGYALGGDELAAGRRSFAVTLEIPAGGRVGDGLGVGEAAKIMTGAPLPPGADTVVPVEQTRQEGAVVTIVEPSRPGANVRRAAEDVAAGDVVLRRGARLGPAEVGLLASLGFTSVTVARRPRVAIVATGSELVPPGEPLGPGQIHNSNAFTAYGQVLSAGGEPVPLGIARDDVDETRRLLLRAFEEDVVVTSGGVSVGEFDFVKQVQEELGVERRFWGVATKPGKPVAFGTRGETLVFGVPGNPVAAMVSFELYVRPALLAMQGRADIYRPVVTAAAAEPVKGGKGRLEMRRCRLDRRESGWLFSTTGPQGSGVLRSMALADGLAFIPAQHPGSEAGAEFVVMLLRGSSTERPPFPR